jgi:ribosomal protein S18 acetylase RimI-like enzyme
MSTVFFLPNIGLESRLALKVEGAEITCANYVSEGESDQIFVVYEKAKNEITEPIDTWKKSSFIEKAEGHMKNFARIVTAKSGDKIIGVCLGYRHSQDKTRYHIDFLYVDKKFRRKEIAVNCIARLISETYSIEGIAYFTATTQATNTNAINVLRKLGFKTKAEFEPSVTLE